MAIVLTDDKHYQAIADKVRSLGVEGTMLPSEMANKVQSVYDTGYEKGKAEGGNTESAYNEGVKAGKQSVWGGTQENGARQSYSYFLYNMKNVAEWFYPEFDIAPTTLTFFARDAKAYNSEALFDFAERIAECGISFDLSNATDVSYCFYNARFSRVPVLNLSKATSTATMFGSYVRTVDKMIATENTAFRNSTFDYAANLERIIFEGVIAASLIMKACRNLDVDSILSIFRTLKRYASTDTGYLANTLTLHADVWDRINTAYPNGTEDMPFGDYTNWQDYILYEIGWNT